MVTASKAEKANLRIEIIGSPFCRRKNEGKSDEHAVRTFRIAWAQAFGGERQGQEIDAANTAGIQSETSLGYGVSAGCEVIPLCNKIGAESNSKNLSGSSGRDRDFCNVPARALATSNPA